GEVRVAKPGKDGKGMIPGGLLADDLTVFVRAGFSSELRVTSHVENLDQSACKRASGDKLWCGTCHDPHTVPEPAQKAADFRGKCLSGHKSKDSKAAREASQANGDACTMCHMPRGAASDIKHVVFPDHSIRRKPAGSGAPPSPDSALVPYPAYAA